MSLASRAWALVQKDLLIESRTKQSFNAMVFFAGLVLFIFSFAIGPDTDLLRQIAGGLLWVGITFTGMLSLSRTYQSEEAAGGLEALRQYPGDHRAVYLGKLATNVFLLLVCGRGWQRAVSHCHFYQPPWRKAHSRSRYRQISS